MDVPIENKVGTVCYERRYNDIDNYNGFMVTVVNNGGSVSSYWVGSRSILARELGDYRRQGFKIIRQRNSTNLPTSDGSKTPRDGLSDMVESEMLQPTK